MKTVSSGIYCIKCGASGKVYIGQALNIGARWSHHKSLLCADRHKNPHLQLAWNLYGPDAFSFHVLELCSPDKLSDRELSWIAKLNSGDRKCGYNLRSGGRQGGAHSEETKLKIAAATRGRKNKSPSPETRAKLSAALLGRKNGPRSPETKAKLSAIQKGRKRGPRSPETKAKISASQKGRVGRKHSPESRAKISKSLREQWASGTRKFSKINTPHFGPTPERPAPAVPAPELVPCRSSSACSPSRT